MEELSFASMEAIQGGGDPTNTQIACYVIGVVYGFIHPVLGIIAGAACLYAD